MGKNARITAIAVAGLLAFAALQFWMARTRPASPVLIEVDRYSKESLQPAADKLNKSLPKMIDDETRLDKATADTRLLTYHYTLTTVSKDGMDIDAYRTKQLASVASNSCLRYRIPFDNGVRMRYVYQDKAGLPLFDMMLDAAACRQQAAPK